MTIVYQYLLLYRFIYIFKILWFIHAKVNKNLNKILWLDKKRNTLAHHAAKLHDLKFWNFIRKYPLDLSAYNNDGYPALHYFIASSFYKKTIGDSIEEKEKALYFNFNKELLKEIVSLADVMQLMKFPNLSKLGWSSDEVGSLNKKNIAGTSLELLIHLYWDFNSYNKNNNNNKNDSFSEFYQILREKGSDINSLKPNSKKVASLFFARFLSSDDDWPVLKIIMSDPCLDFSLTEEDGNTILHILFARISTRLHVLSDAVVKEIINTIAANKNIEVEHLYIKNTSLIPLTPLDCMKNGFENLSENLIASIRYEKIDAILPKENIVVQKIKKI